VASHFRYLEYRLYFTAVNFTAISKAGSKIPVLSTEDEDRILAALQPDLAGRQLRPKVKKDIFRRVALARLTYQHLTEKDSSQYKALLTWSGKQDEELLRVRSAANDLVSAIKACQPATRTRFYYTSHDDTNYKQLMASATMIAAIVGEAYEQRPPLSASRQPDYAFNGFVLHLVTAWCRATRLPLSRSTNRGRSPVEFISTVLAVIGQQSDVRRIESAIRWLLRLRGSQSQIPVG
jgi:hypothetical protein